MTSPSPTRLHKPRVPPPDWKTDENRWLHLGLRGLSPKLDMDGWRRATLRAAEARAEQDDTE